MPTDQARMDGKADERRCGLCKHHTAHPLRPTDDRICGVLLKDCAQITVTPDHHECDFHGFEKKAN